MVNNIEKKLARVIRKSAQEKMPDFLLMNDIQILMPLEVTLMRSDFSKIQLSVLISLIEKMAYKIKERIEIQKIINGEYSESKTNGVQLTLWSDEEWQVNEKNERIFRLKLAYKEVGVKTNHYDQLESSLKALAGLPISFPYKDQEGKRYTKYTNFCDVIIPENQNRNKYCYVEFEEKIARALTKVDFGYHYVGKKASEFFGNCSKYCERIYFFIQGYQNVGTVRITSAEFRKRYGLENCYKNFSAIRTGILDVSAREIKKVFDLGGCPCWFEYKEIFKGNKTSGEPYEIEFLIHKENVKSKIDRQFTIEESFGRDKFKEILLEDLHLSPKYVDGQLKRLTDENCQAAISCALNIKIYIESGKVDNPTYYAAKSLSNFFETYKPSKREEVKDPRQMWAKFITEICKNAPKADTNNIYSRMLFDSFSEEKKELVIAIPNMDFADKISDHQELVLSLLGKHFGKNIKIKYTINKEA